MVISSQTESGGVKRFFSSLLANGGLAPGNLAAVGITNQRATTAVWDRSSTPVHNAITWQDIRAAGEVTDLAADGGPNRFRAATGLPLAPAFSGHHMRWLLQNLPGAQARAAAGDLMFGTIDSWLLWSLTGQHISDVSNATVTQLMNLHTLDWDPEILAILGIPRATLPSLVPSSAVYGAARGVLEGVPMRAAWATKRRPWSGRPVSDPARPRIPTAPPSSWS